MQCNYFYASAPSTCIRSSTSKTNNFQSTDTQLDMQFAEGVSAHKDKIVSDELYAYFETIVDFWILLSISCFGVITNALNIAVFTRQGFKDGLNMSMMAIALWDFLKCFCGLFHRLYGPIGLASPALGQSWRNFTFPYIEYTPVFAGYVSYALATYVSIERCLCVTMPFKVKSMFTPRFTLCIVSIISISVYGAYFVMYFVYDVHWLRDPSLNTTIARFMYNDFYYKHQDVVMVYYKTAAILIPFISFVILCICSAITVFYLRKSSKTLQSINHEGGSSENSSGISQREKQVVKMLLVVIIVYIGNLFPRMILYMAQLAEPEFYVLRFYNNIFVTTAKFLFILDFTNASINFFIFLKMSSNFRSTYFEMFPMCQTDIPK